MAPISYGTRRARMPDEIDAQLPNDSRSRDAPRTCSLCSAAASTATPPNAMARTRTRARPWAAITAAAVPTARKRRTTGGLPVARTADAETDRSATVRTRTAPATALKIARFLAPSSCSSRRQNADQRTEPYWVGQHTEAGRESGICRLLEFFQAYVKWDRQRRRLGARRRRDVAVQAVPARP